MSAKQLWELGALAFLILAALAGCGTSGHSTQESAGSAAPVPLPAVPELAAKLKPHTAAYVAADLQKSGADYDPTLPLQRVTANGNEAHFDPQWDSPAQVGFDKLAFATYDFTIKSYAGAPRIVYT